MAIPSKERIDEIIDCIRKQKDLKGDIENAAIGGAVGGGFIGVPLVAFPLTLIALAIKPEIAGAVMVTSVVGTMCFGAGSEMSEVITRKCPKQ